ncbi:MAG: J domain-containing protein [Chthoniobacteraceae bacterium]
MHDLRESYRILDLHPGVSLDEVKRAYREQVKIWHPDRFVSDPILQEKAQEKLRQANLAYERLTEQGAIAIRMEPVPETIPEAAPAWNAEPTLHGPKTIRCKRCRRRFWSDAEKCPKCGARNRMSLEVRFALSVAFIIALVALFVYVISQPSKPEGMPPPLPEER